MLNVLVVLFLLFIESECLLRVWPGGSGEGEAAAAGAVKVAGSAAPAPSVVCSRTPAIIVSLPPSSDVEAACATPESAAAAAAAAPAAFRFDLKLRRFLKQSSLCPPFIQCCFLHWRSQYLYYIIKNISTCENSFFLCGVGKWGWEGEQSAFAQGICTRPAVCSPFPQLRRMLK